MLSDFNVIKRDLGQTVAKSVVETIRLVNIVQLNTKRTLEIDRAQNERLVRNDRIVTEDRAIGWMSVTDLSERKEVQNDSLELCTTINVHFVLSRETHMRYIIIIFIETNCAMTIFHMYYELHRCSCT